MFCGVWVIKGGPGVDEVSWECVAESACFDYKKVRCEIRSAGQAGGGLRLGVILDKVSGMRG